MEERKLYKLKDFIQFNPTERIAKGVFSRKIAMEQLNPYTRYVSSDNFENYKGGAKFKNGDTIMARITPCLENGKTAYISSLEENEVAFGSTEYIVLRNIANVSDSKYIYYLAIYPLIRNIAIQSMVGSSGRQRVQQSVLENYEFMLPPICEQKRIANLLSSLDDKIELNRRINDNLEQQAQALFKSWFVDFDPFKDGNFVDSELGMIPEGWSVDVLSNFGKIVCGKTPSKAKVEYFGGNIPFIKIPDMHNNTFILTTNDSLSNEGSNSQANKLIPPYSILVSCIATVGLVSFNTKYSQTNQQINTIIPTNSKYRHFLYQQLNSMNEFIENLGRGGTATLNVNTSQFSGIKIKRPNEEVINMYENVVAPIYSKIEKLYLENKILSIQRDCLLPKLMSGELKINNLNC